MRFGAKSGDSGGYQIEKSLRIRSGASAYLNRTPASAGNRRKFTISAWVKRSRTGTNAADANASSLFGAGNTGNSPGFKFAFSDIVNGSNKCVVSFQETVHNVSNQFVWYGSAEFRDPANWYHIVAAFDTTQANQADRLKVWVNNQLLSGTYVVGISQNQDLSWNNNVPQFVGASTLNVAPWLTYLDGYLTEVVSVDGQQLDPTSFGQFDPANPKRWIPKKYTGTYGTNGFYLPFNDGTSTTTLGQDRSGNGNNWTLNNVSLTAGATYDWMSDTPTNNFAVLNVLGATLNGGAIYSGNLSSNSAFNGGESVVEVGIGFVSGLFYWEPEIINNAGSGQCSVGVTGAYGWAGADGTAGMTSFGIYGVAANADTGKVWVRNSTGWISGDPVAGTSPSFTFTPGSLVLPQCRTRRTPSKSDAAYAHWNFGQRPFAYTPPTGFKALCTANLPTAAIPNPLDHYFKTTVTKSGDTNITIPWDATQYDTLIEIKRRDAAGDWYQVDGLRGYDKILKSNSTAAETTDANVVGVSGTTITLKSTLPNGTYLVKCRKAGLASARQTNTSGTITSTVSANTVSGFSIVTYTGLTAAGSVGHGLGSVPSMKIVKNRGQVGTSWTVGHKNLSTNYYLLLESTAAQSNASTPFTGDTSTTIGIQNALVTAWNFVAYCHAEVSGYSKFGSATGNGSADGWFAYAGGLVGDALVKTSTNTGGYGWYSYNSTTQPYNVIGNYLYQNQSVAEAVYPLLDFVSNGIKIRESGIGNNGSGDTYIYALWNDQPIQTANAR